MTDEEAVKIIESEHVWLPRTYGWRKVEDAHEMAIKALRNQAKYETALATAMHDCEEYLPGACKGCQFEGENGNKCKLLWIPAQWKISLRKGRKEE